MAGNDRFHFALFGGTAVVLLVAFYLVASLVLPTRVRHRARPARPAEVVTLSPSLTYRDMSRFVALHLSGEKYSHGNGYNCWTVAGSDDRWAANFCIAGPGVPGQ